MFHEDLFITIPKIGYMARVTQSIRPFMARGTSSSPPNTPSMAALLITPR